MELNQVLSVTLKQKIEIQQNGRSEKEINNDLLIIREWLVKQAHLPQNIDSYFIERVLRLNKFSLEKTKNKLDMYYSCRSLIPEYFTNRDPLSPGIQKYMDIVSFFPMPKLTSTNCRIFIFRIENKNSDLFHLENHARYIFSMFDLTLHRDTAEKHIYIVDYTNVTFGHIVKWHMAFIKKIFTLMLEAYSDRIHGMHMIFLPAFANTFMDIIKSLLKNKIAGRVMAHKNVESLQKEINLDDLPSDFGGSQKSINDLFSDWKEYFISQKHWLVEQEKIKSNELLRVGKSIDEDLFGSIHGSFRVLNVD